MRLFFFSIQKILPTVCLLCFQSIYAAPVSRTTQISQSIEQNIPSIFQISRVIEELNQSKKQLTEKLDTLPNLNDTLQFNGYGYHSDYLPILAELPTQPRWTLDFEFRNWVELTEIILVPAVDHRFGQLGSYGFPTRFRVLSVQPDGSTNIIKEWMNHDCPDPGRFPLSINAPQPWSSKIRIEIFRGQPDGDFEFIAMDELIGIFGVLNHKCISVTASSEYESLPYWSTRFINDQKMGLGLPLGVITSTEGKKNTEDFSVVFDTAPTNGCTVEVDLGTNRTLGWVTLFPAHPPENIMIPGYGFPSTISMKIIPENPDGTRGPSHKIPTKWSNQLQPGNNVIRLPSSEGHGRWIQIHATQLPHHNGKPTFALGEIHVHQRDTTYPIQSIRLEGFPETATANAYVMGDGKASGQPVMFLHPWLQQIEQRNKISHTLEWLTARTELLQSRRDRAWQISGISTIFLLALIAISVAIISVMQRRKQLQSLKWRITRDLHDDVGSSLGSISLAAGQLERRATDEWMKEGLIDLSLMAREACVSLREVVWVIDQGTIRLPALLRKLSERAERVLTGIELTIDIPADCPDAEVSLETKRHLLMFFKEVVHNCARHANATCVSVVASINNHQLHLQVQDNGCGFDPSIPADGWGLNSLTKRAEEMGGKMELESQIGTGTTIVLTIPLESLSRDPEHTYKTSN